MASVGFCTQMRLAFLLAFVFGIAPLLASNCFAWPIADKDCTMQSLLSFLFLLSAFGRTQLREAQVSIRAAFDSIDLSLATSL